MYLPEDGLAMGESPEVDGDTMSMAIKGWGVHEKTGILNPDCEVWFLISAAELITILTGAMKNKNKKKNIIEISILPKMNFQ